MSDRHTTALTALAPATWGTTYIVTTELLPPDRPLLAGALRVLPIGLLLLVAARSLPQGSWWWRSGVLGALNMGIFMGLLFLAAYRLPGGVAAVLVSSAPLLVVGLAWPLLGEPPTRYSVAAAAIGLAGVALLVLRPDAQLDALGLFAAIAAAASLATGVVLTKRWGRPSGILPFTAWQLVAGGLLLTPVSLAVEGAPPALDAEAVAGIAYLGVVGAGLTYPLWFNGIARLAATRVSMLSLLSPLVAVIAGVAIAEERFGIAETIGSVLVLLAVLLGQRPQPQAPVASPDRPDSVSSEPLPARAGPAPRVIGPRPHAQRSQNAPERLQEQLAGRVLALPGVREAPSAVSVAGARGFVLDGENGRGPAEAFQAGREFAHLHPPADGSLHMTLPEHVAAAAYASGWGQPRPVSRTPLIFGPRDEEELEVVWRLLHSSYNYAAGRGT